MICLQNVLLQWELQNNRKAALHTTLPSSKPWGEGFSEEVTRDKGRISPVPKSKWAALVRDVLIQTAKWKEPAEEGVVVASPCAVRNQQARSHCSRSGSTCQRCCNCFYSWMYRTSDPAAGCPAHPFWNGKGRYWIKTEEEVLLALLGALLGHRGSRSPPCKAGTNPPLWLQTRILALPGGGGEEGWEISLGLWTGSSGLTKCSF